MGVNPEAMLSRFQPGGGEAGCYRQLDWPQLLEAVARRCHSDGAREVAVRMPLLDDALLVERRLGEVSQVIAMFDACDAVVGITVTDMEDILLRAERGAVLSGEDLTAVAGNLATFRAVRRFFEVRREDAPLLWGYAEDIDPASDLERRLSASFDAEGRLVDAASPELSQLRERGRRLAESLRSRIESRLAACEAQGILQDSYYTQREGRYVLPILASQKGKIAGIVHATSASGQTVFVEPSELVELNNALRMCDFAIEAEEQRILQMLSQLVGQRREAFSAGVRRCVYLDLVIAVARFALDCGCHIPELSVRNIELYQARHPLLALRKFENPQECVVANDIMLHDEQEVFVISGANAGGKTVNLKTVGLFALMTKAGIPICAGASSCFPLFGNVFADIGDDQSIAQNISTFSAHVQNLAHALGRVDARSLFLLDEPFSGTDPEHASPLVIALVNHLHARHAACFVTTHFENVKAFALETPWVASGSVSFDLEQMKPTYQLQIGHPGTSAAFEIAQQHGLCADILRQAREIYDAKATSCLESAIGELEKQRVRLEEAREVVAGTQARLDAEREEVEALRKSMREQAAQTLGSDIVRLQETVGKLRARIGKLRKKMFSPEFRKQRELQEEVDRALCAVDEEARKQQSETRSLTAPPFKALPEREIVIGKTVQIRQYRKNATVLARSGNHVTLQLGILQVHALVSDLGVPLAVEASKPALTARQRRILDAKPSKPVEIHNNDADLIDESTKRPLMAQISDNTLDLRGLVSEDAVERTAFFLQSMMIHEQKMCYIIHGHGTGVLKSCIRQYLQRSPLVVDMRPGQYYEGGDGVTLVWLKS